MVQRFVGRSHSRVRSRSASASSRKSGQAGTDPSGFESFRGPSMVCHFQESTVRRYAEPSCGRPEGGEAVVLRRAPAGSCKLRAQFQHPHCTIVIRLCCSIISTPWRPFISSLCRFALRSFDYDSPFRPLFFVGASRGSWTRWKKTPAEPIPAGT